MSESTVLTLWVFLFLLLVLGLFIFHSLPARKPKNSFGYSFSVGLLVFIEGYIFTFGVVFALTSWKSGWLPQSIWDSVALVGLSLLISTWVLVLFGDKLKIPTLKQFLGDQGWLREKDSCTGIPGREHSRKEDLYIEKARSLNLAHSIFASLLPFLSY